MKITRRPGTRFCQMLISAQIGLLVAMVPSVGFAEDGEAVSGSVFANVVESAGKAAAIGFDVGILRTLGSIRVVVGAVALIPTSIIYLLKMPIDGDAGALLDVVDILVVEPAEFVFRRPLGADFAGG